jgi:hypothetical protein
MNSVNPSEIKAIHDISAVCKGSNRECKHVVKYISTEGRYTVKIALMSGLQIRQLCYDLEYPCDTHFRKYDKQITIADDKDHTDNPLVDVGEVPEWAKSYYKKQNEDRTRMNGE